MREDFSLAKQDHVKIGGNTIHRYLSPMEIRNRADQTPFITKDGSTILSLLDRTNAPVANQSLAEATIPAGAETERHYHKLSEEFYYILQGSGVMEIDGGKRKSIPAMPSSSLPELGTRSTPRRTSSSSAAALRRMPMRIRISLIPSQSLGKEMDGNRWQRSLVRVCFCWRPTEQHAVSSNRGCLGVTLLWLVSRNICHLKVGHQFMNQRRNRPRYR